MLTCSCTVSVVVRSAKHQLSLVQASGKGEQKWVAHQTWRSNTATKLVPLLHACGSCSCRCTIAAAAAAALILQKQHLPGPAQPCCCQRQLARLLLPLLLLLARLRRCRRRRAAAAAATSGRKEHAARELRDQRIAARVQAAGPFGVHKIKQQLQGRTVGVAEERQVLRWMGRLQQLGKRAAHSGRGNSKPDLQVAQRQPASRNSTHHAPTTTSEPAHPPAAAPPAGSGVNAARHPGT